MDTGNAAEMPALREVEMIAPTNSNYSIDHVARAGVTTPSGQRTILLGTVDASVITPDGLTIAGGTNVIFVVGGSTMPKRIESVAIPAMLKSWKPEPDRGMSLEQIIRGRGPVKRLEKGK